MASYFQNLYSGSLNIGYDPLQDTPDFDTMLSQYNTGTQLSYEDWCAETGSATCNWLDEDDNDIYKGLRQTGQEVATWKASLDSYNPIHESLSHLEKEYKMKSRGANLEMTYLQALDAKERAGYQQYGFAGSGVHQDLGSRDSEIERAFSREVESVVGEMNLDRIGAARETKDYRMQYVDDLWNEWDYFVQTTDMALAGAEDIEYEDVPIPPHGGPYCPDGLPVSHYGESEDDCPDY